MRSEGYCSWVCLCVCLSVKSHLTYGASVRPENAVTYSAGNEGQKVCGVFSESAPLPRSSTPSVVWPCDSRPFFSCTRMRISRVYTRMIHRRGFSTLVLFIVHVTMLRQRSLDRGKRGARRRRHCVSGHRARENAKEREKRLSRRRAIALQ